MHINKVMKASFEVLEAIKFSHSIFALPFALLILLLVNRGSLPSIANILWIICAMVGARTFAMGVNRVVDNKIDAINPRTQNRALPAGRISARQMLTLIVLSGVFFLYSTWNLSPLAFYFAIPVLICLGLYSYTKRFTWLCHYYLGFCLGMAPMAVWVALRNEINISILWLCFAILFWVAGFDILYSLQDYSFDKNHKLYSIPAIFGTKVAINMARILHIFALTGFFVFGHIFSLGIIYNIGVLISFILILTEHLLIWKGGLKHINLAFFNLNGWVAVLLFLSTCLSLYLE